MPRLIDADELKKMFPDKGEGAWTYNITAKAYIDAQPTIDQWHYPSKGELPPKWGFYLVTLEYSDTRFVTLASWHELEHKWYGFNGDWYNPVAWMPLPDPPKEEA